ncbi:hypothetical protein LZ554_005422 [Drepanopeziza brunnea f. sp. 'monogermtubi']|nr:hypothetical protein LZ554_005422 [Drepanopeziza brunnea f. sp. 'monogermtubi']
MAESIEIPACLVEGNELYDKLSQTAIYDETQVEDERAASLVQNANLKRLVIKIRKVCADMSPPADHRLRLDVAEALMDKYNGTRFREIVANLPADAYACEGILAFRLLDCELMGERGCDMGPSLTQAFLNIASRGNPLADASIKLGSKCLAVEELCAQNQALIAELQSKAGVDDEILVFATDTSAEEAAEIGRR